MNVFELTEPDGSPRYYPPGQHPAIARMSAHLRKVEQCKRDYAAARARVGIFLPQPLTELQASIDYIGEKIAAFEEGEAEARARDDLILRGRRR